MIMKCGCGKLISRHMHGKCLACRYEEMKKIKIKEPVRCKFCGKEFIPHFGSKYCGSECLREQRRIRDRINGQQLITKTCARCGKEYQAHRTCIRDLCFDCKQLEKEASHQNLKPDVSARTEKMRKIKASGMTYGQYMASGGARPEEPAETIGTLKQTETWMTGPSTIQVMPPEFRKPKARLKRRVI